jgi:hypothetical protein
MLMTVAVRLSSLLGLLSSFVDVRVCYCIGWSLSYGVVRTGSDAGRAGWRIGVISALLLCGGVEYVVEVSHAF